ACDRADTPGAMTRRLAPESEPGIPGGPAGADRALEPGVEAEEEPDELDAEALQALEAAIEAQDPLALYVRQIGDGPLLTRAEERELARRKDAGDEEAKRRLIEANLRLVMS